MFDKYTKQIENAFTARGFEIRKVGGAVRDMLLGLNPKDIDLCTDATPDEMIEIAKQAGFGVLPIGLAHGTIAVIVEPGSEPVEITTLRIDTDCDGRHANVQYTKNFFEDAQRRDLTINAMSMSSDGTLYDYFGGQEDLRNQVVRFVGDGKLRVQEDWLRALRAVRFLARFEKGTLDSEATAALEIASNHMHELSVERIWSEMQRILVSKNTVVALDVLAKTGLIGGMGIVVNTTADFAALPDTNNPVTRMVWLCKNALDIVEQWKLSNSERRLAEFLTGREIPTVKQAQIELFDGVGSEWMDELFRLNGVENPVVDWAVPKLPVRGQDLVDFGVEPGPEIGKCIKKARELFIESDFSMSKKELIAKVV